MSINGDDGDGDEVFFRMFGDRDGDLSKAGRWLCDLIGGGQKWWSRPKEKKKGKMD